MNINYKLLHFMRTELYFTFSLYLSRKKIETRDLDLLKLNFTSCKSPKFHIRNEIYNLYLLICLIYRGWRLTI